MGLLSKLRAWIGGGNESASTDDDGADGADGDDHDNHDADDTDDDQTGLDPSAATETRTAATDDAVDALRDVRRSQNADSPDESATRSDEPDTGSDRDAP